MTKIETWPPPRWRSIKILWADVFDGPRYPIREILDWIDSAPGGDYHLSGLNEIKGFDFRFRDPKDATYFVMMWL